MELFAQLLLKSRTGAYIEWLAKEVIMTANKLDLMNILLVMLFTNIKKTVVGAKMCLCAGHTASWMDLLDGARLEICLASTQGQPILRIPPEACQSI